MGRSQETWNKKEAEKKKAKNKKDKEQKKQERKANSKSGSSLDDMIAYVDENGQISSTPPDPDKKSKIKVEDILTSVPKKGIEDPADSIRKGVISFFNDSKGYGFIRDLETQESIFVHLNGLVDAVKESDMVTFNVEQSPKGLNAYDVKLVVK
ncbi:MAG: cold shock domain-containing protein [Bacteroidota bacterium]